MTDGAYLMDKIRARCVEEGDCLLWQGALSAGSTPVARHQGANHNLRRFVWTSMGGALPKKGKAFITKCRDKRCLAASHLAVGSRSRPGVKRSVEYRARAAAARQARSTLTWDDVHAIRASDKTLDELCVEYGKAKRTIQCIRSGITWKVTTGHFAGLGARA